MVKQTERAKGSATKAKAVSDSNVARGGWVIYHSTAKGISKIYETRVGAVMAAAERTGLLLDKNGRIGGRVSPLLVKLAKEKTGITTDTDLIEFALANVALEDRFAEAFKAVRGTVDPDLKLGF